MKIAKTKITRRPSRLLALGGVLLVGAIVGCGGVSYGGNQHSTTTGGQGQAQVRQGGQQQASMPSPSAAKPSPSAVKPHATKTVVPKTTHSAPTVAAAQQPKSEIPQNNGGDADPDNNGAPSDGDGGI